MTKRLTLPIDTLGLQVVACLPIPLGEYSNRDTRHQVRSLIDTGAYLIVRSTSHCFYSQRMNDTPRPRYSPATDKIQTYNNNDNIDDI